MAMRSPYESDGPMPGMPRLPAPQLPVPTPSAGGLPPPAQPSTTPDVTPDAPMPVPSIPIPTVPYPADPRGPLIPPVAQTWLQAHPLVLPIGGGLAALLLGITIGVAVGRRRSSRPAF